MVAARQPPSCKVSYSDWRAAADTAMLMGDNAVGLNCPTRIVVNS